MSEAWEACDVAGREMQLFVASPEGAGPRPAVVVICHAGGVDEFVMEMTRRIAGEGYVGAAPDLFHRITDEMVEETGKSKRDQLSDPDLIADVNATVDFLLGHSSIDSGRLGVTGFCSGGRVVWLAAATNANFKAAVPHYGGNIMVPWGAATQSPFDLTSAIKCPVMFHFGEVDTNLARELDHELDFEVRTPETTVGSAVVWTKPKIS